MNLQGRWRMVGIIFGVCSLLGLSHYVMSAEPKYRMESLGYANQAVSYDNNLGLVAPGPDGKGKYFYISYYRSGGRAELLAYDRQTKKRLRFQSGSNGLYGLMRASNGVIYAGGISPGCLYAVRPGTSKLANLGNPGIEFIWDLTEAPDGRIYGGCYPGSKLLEFDPKTKTCKIAVTLDKSRAYLRNLAAAPDGKIWCNASHLALLYIYDPKTGEKKQVLPPEFRSNSFTGPIMAKGKYMYIAQGLRDKKTGKTVILQFEAGTGKLVRRLKATGRGVPGDYQKGLYLYDSDAGTLYFHEPETGKVKVKALLKKENLGSCKWLEANRYLHGLIDQDYYCYDLKEKTFLARARLTPPGQAGMEVYSLCAGPDGNIYGGAYINQHLWKVDAATGKVIELGRHRRGGGQIESVASGGGLVWCGSYTRAHIASYDPGKPWNPGPGADNNPRDYGSVGQGQYRTRCILYGPDGKVYLGSYPSYSSGSGSAMSVLDPATGKVVVYKKFSPRCLAAGKKHIFGWTGVTFFDFDPKEKKIVFSLKISGLSAMVGLPDGRIACAVGDSLQIFDPAKKQFTVKKQHKLGRVNALCVGRKNSLYGISKTAVFRINLTDMSTDTLHGSGGKFLAEDRFGNLYFARGAKLFRLVRGK